MWVVFCRCGIRTRFSSLMPSTLYSHTGRPDSSRNPVRYLVVSNSLPALVSTSVGSDTIRPSGQRSRSHNAFSITVRPNGVGSAGDQQCVIPARQCAGDRSRGVAAETVGHQPFFPDQRLPSFVGGIPPQPIAPVQRRAFALPPSDFSGRSTVAACPRTFHPSAPATSGVPPPPYSGASLDHSSRQEKPDGGARSGSANDGFTRSTPKLTTSSRSPSSRSLKKRTANAAVPSTAPSTSA